MTDYAVIPGQPAEWAQTRTNRHLIGGVWQDGAASFERQSPSHGVLVSRSARGTRAEAEAAIAAARAAFDAGDWAQTPGKDRAAILLRVADMIEARVDALALVEVMESGKPITQARAEMAGAADIWRYAAALARTSPGESHDSLGPDMLGLVLRQPVGVVAMITPWNFPLLIVSQKLPFALAAGCTAVVKPSELTPSTTVMLAEMLVEAGLPAGVCNIVLGFGDPVGTTLTEDERVDMVSFTGSTGVGRRIAGAAGARLARVALELGGKNPQVVFPDADLDAAADAIVFGVYFNAGECCNSGSRIIVHKDVAETLTDKVVALSRRVTFGDPLHPDTQVGALISTQHRDRIAGYVAGAAQAGARIALGGGTLAVEGLPGAFWQPTVVTGVTPDMAIAREEVFGPVLSVLTFDGLEEAVTLANDASYGLSAGVWSENVHVCLQFARSVHAGTVWTNTWMDGYAELPFGGVKQSGLGRELGRQAIAEYQELKTVQMRIGRSRAAWVRP